MLGGKKLIKIGSVFRGLLTSFILLFFFSLLLGGLITLAEFDDSLTDKILFVLNYIAIFIGGLHSAYLAANNGWLNGGLVGLIYILIVIVLGSFWNPITFSISLFTRALTGFLVSGTGGMIGVNII